MSFADFDYTPLVNKLNKLIVEYQDNVTKLTEDKSSIEQTVYSEVLEYQLEKLEKEIKKNTSNIEKCQETITEINNIQNLSVEEKGMLYYFWTVLEVDKIDYMMKIPFNYVEPLASNAITQLVNDEVTSKEVKTKIAKFIYKKYNIDSRHSRQLLLLKHL